MRFFIIFLLTVGIWVLTYTLWFHSRFAMAHGTNHAHYKKDIVDLKTFSREDIEKIIENCELRNFAEFKCYRVKNYYDD